MQRPRILVGDNDLAVRSELVNWLRRQGYETVSAGTGTEAIDAAQKDHVTAAVLELSFPDMEGRDAMAHIRVHRRECKFLFVTASSALPAVVEAIRAGGFDCLAKPLRNDAVLASLRRALEQGEDARPIGGANSLRPEHWLAAADCQDVFGVTYVNSAIQFMLRKFADPTLHTGTVATATGISRDYLRHLMCRHAGKGTMSVLHDIRVAEAEWLLTSTPLSVKEVIARCGYRSYSGLDLHFKGVFGILPREARRRSTSPV